MMTKNDQVKLLVQEAEKYAEDAAGLLGEAMRTDASLVSAQISIAKSLAVIAWSLVEINQRYKDQYINQP